ncbi:hypothetical protein DFH09DRAFT_1352462 [Mycena vulgaris]|nr:hypothetical protein DFH09DRAFT_1352462 [Mycena vulgaris]
MRDLGVGFVSTPPVTSLAAGVLKRLATVALDGGPANAPHHSRSSKRSVTVTGDVGGGSRDGSRAPCDPSDFCDRLPPSLICCDSHTLHFKTAPGSSAPSAAKTCAQYGPFEVLQKRSIRITHKLGKTCTQVHTDRVHTCSLCGGDHPALSRDGDCKRAGAFPYDADAFGALLQKHKLTTAYPSSLKNLREALIERPVLRSEMERVCHGPFYASPLIVVSRSGPVFDAKKRPAVNDFIAKEDDLICPRSWKNW